MEDDAAETGNAYGFRQSPLANAGSAVVGKNKQSIGSEPQEIGGAAALPDLDIDPLQQDDSRSQASWDYKDLAGAKVENEGASAVGGQQIQSQNRPAFNINRIDSEESDFL